MINTEEKKEMLNIFCQEAGLRAREDPHWLLFWLDLVFGFGVNAPKDHCLSHGVCQLAVNVTHSGVCDLTTAIWKTIRRNSHRTLHCEHLQLHCHQHES